MPDAPCTLRELAETWEKRIEDMHHLPMRREMGKWLHELNAVLAAATPASTPEQREILAQIRTATYIREEMMIGYPTYNVDTYIAELKNRLEAAQRDRQGQGK